MIKIDVQSQEITDALNNAQVYVKHAKVHAVQVTEETYVETIMSDGFVETKDTAKPGQFIVTNPDGEEYIRPEGQFRSRYNETDVEGVYEAVGVIRAIPNPFNDEIEIEAPWGKPQYGKSNCLIAVSITDPTEPVSKARYIIDPDAFLSTYILMSN